MIVAVGVNRYVRNSDKYIVRFEDGSVTIFWEFQLKGVGAAA